MLWTIPGLEVHEIPEADICCGSAGVCNLVEPDTAAEPDDRKAQLILTTGAAAVVSSNPGRLLQIASRLEQAQDAQ